MSKVEKLRSLAVEEYLDGEGNGEVRHELVCGHVYAMVGASNFHNLLAGSLYSMLRQNLKDSCRVYMSDMKVRVGDDFYYPDVVVSCKVNEGVFYYLHEPLIIVEVLSPSTERQDRLEKRIAYQRLKSLQEYLLITQDKIQVEIFRLVADGWELETYNEGDVVRLSSIGLEFAIEDLYEYVLNN